MPQASIPLEEISVILAMQPRLTWDEVAAKLNGKVAGRNWHGTSVRHVVSQARKAGDKRFPRRRPGPRASFA